jgi:uncharacterized protein with HEPN domain
MQPEAKKFLFDMLEAVNAAQEFAAARTLAQFTQDKLIRSATYYQFVIIGEAMSQLRKLDPETQQNSRATPDHWFPQSDHSLLWQDR